MTRRIAGAIVCLTAAAGIAALSAGTASAGVRITGTGDVTDWSNPRSGPDSSIFGADSVKDVGPAGAVAAGRDF